MNLLLKEVAYNTFKQKPKTENIEVDLSVKFGIDKEKFEERVIFLELNMDGNTDDDDNNEPTRKLFVVAIFQYKAPLSKYEDFKKNHSEKEYREELLENQAQDDQEHLIVFLKRINDLVINMTSFDDNRTTLDIEPAIEMYETENV